MVAGSVEKDPVQPIEYSPPVTLIGDAELIPLIVALAETRKEASGTPHCVANANGSGLVSHTTVVTLNALGVPAIVKVAVVVVAQFVDAVCRTITVWPELIVPGVIV